MNKEESKKVKLGEMLNLVDVTTTPGRTFSPILGGEVEVKGILTEESGYRHFDVGMTITAQDTPLKSRDTGEEIDGSNIYWLHPSRFEKN